MSSRTRRRIPRLHLSGVVIAIPLLAGLSLVLFPIVWMTLASMRPLQETLGNPPVWIPRELTLKAYVSLLSSPVQRSYQLNTYIIALSTAGLSTALGSLAAYGFSRFRIRGAQLVLLGIMALQMMPSVSVLIPFYRMAKWLGIYDTYWAMIVADTAFALPIVIWMLKSYMDGVPVDIEEAALVDGCSRLQMFGKVVLPLTLPGLIGSGTYAFLYAWNDFAFAVILRTGPKVMPLTIAMAEFFTQHNRDWQSIMALNTLATLPLLATFVFLQRWIVRGLTAGAIK